MSESAITISLEHIANELRNVNLDSEVLLFDSGFISTHASVFPLRIDALIIQLCINGHGRITIDLVDHNLEPGSIVVLQPKNYINLMDVDSDFESHIIACSKSIVDDVLPKLTDLLPLLLHHLSDPVTTLDLSKAKELDRYYLFLKEVVNQKPSLFHKNKMRCLLQAALFELMDIEQSSHNEDVPMRKSRKEEIMARFILTVREHFRTERQVAFYAKQLCITPKHLSAVVKSISGKTAGEWIENYVTMEAKVLLKTTDLPVQEIAVHLNFPNQSFFGKYFKHITGMSPTEFRRKCT